MTSYFEKPFGKHLLTKSGLKPTSEVLHGKEYVLIYNSAHWCPPCRQFTPILADFYNELRLDKNFEVVFISCDQTESQFESYFGSMPWTAVPYSSSHRESAMRTYNTRGSIPELVLCKADGTILKQGAVKFVYGDPTGDALFS